MLEETKKMYEAQADFIPNWRELSKTDLCNLYIENENDDYLRSCYFSAIILKYWSKIYSLRSNTYLTASYEDVYNWLVEGILYALKHRRWLDENSNVYGDPNGPDKVINRKIKCIRINHLISSNRFKRQVHINLLSLDSFDDPDNFIGIPDAGALDDNIKDIVREYWEDGQYLQSIIIDLIATGDCSVCSEEDGKEDFSYDTLVSSVAKLSTDYAEYFSDRYELPNSIVKSVINSITRQKVGLDLWGYGEYEIDRSISEINDIVNEELSKLSNDDGLRKILK